MPNGSPVASNSETFEHLPLLVHPNCVYLDNGMLVMIARTREGPIVVAVLSPRRFAQVPVTALSRAFES